LKGVAVEWVDHEPADRSALLELSGQRLAPVAEFGGDVVFDSVAILERLDREYPEPPLYPNDPARRSLAVIFVEWFNEVWKVPPNALAAEPAPDGAEADRLGARLAASTELFEQLLRGHAFLFGSEPGIADVCAYPFLRFAVDAPHSSDGDPFHAVLHRHLAPGSHRGIDRWIERVAALPRA
jgi:glutathione S-transferase